MTLLLASTKKCIIVSGIADGAVTLPIQLPRELSSALQSGIAGNFLKLAGIR